jgi:cysteine desulfurase
MPRIYLDNASTTPVDPRVFQSMVPFLKEHFGNPSSVHSFGQESRNAIDRARRQVSNLLNCSPAEVIFTSGGTESNNIAIRGLASRFPGGHIVTTSIEHSAVREVMRDLAHMGHEVTEIDPDANGIIDPAVIEKAIGDGTFLVSVMMANNELGTVQNLREISRIVGESKKRGSEIHLHSDAVQALGKIPVDIPSLDCDLMSFSAHKLYAPKGTGALYVRKGLKIVPQSKGGPHEKGLRPGTENVAGIVAFGAACELCSAESQSEFLTVTAMRDAFESTIVGRISGVTVNGSGDRLPGITNLSFEDVSGESLLILLDQKGFAVSTGSACASGTIEPSHVLLAIGRTHDVAKSSLRVSFGRFNQPEDVDRTVDALVDSVAELRRLI